MPDREDRAISRSKPFELEYGVEGLSPDQAVIMAVSSVTGTTPSNVPPLYQAVDVDALNEICIPEKPSRHEANLSVEFSYANCSVTVRNDGLLTVREEVED